MHALGKDIAPIKYCTRAPYLYHKSDLRVTEALTLPLASLCVRRTRFDSRPQRPHRPRQRSHPVGPSVQSPRRPLYPQRDLTRSPDLIPRPLRSHPSRILLCGLPSWSTTRTSIPPSWTRHEWRFRRPPANTANGHQSGYTLWSGTAQSAT